MTVPSGEIMERRTKEELRAEIERLRTQLTVYEAAMKKAATNIHPPADLHRWPHPCRKQLSLERDRFYKVLDQLPALVYLQAPDYSIPFANRTFIDNFGSYRNAPCYRIIHNRDTPCDDCSTFKVFDSGRARKWDLHDKDKDAFFEIHEIPFADSDGSPLVMVLGIDVTRRRKTRLALQQSEEEKRLLLAQLEAVPDGLVLFDLDGKILWSNRHVMSLMKLDKPLQPGQVCHGTICRHAVCTDCPVQPCIEEGVFQERELLGQDGRQLHFRCYPIRNDKGRVERVILNISDTSRNFNRRINHLRAGQLAAIGELSAGIAHEINNPLNGIINFAQILKDNPEVLRQHPEIPERMLSEGERIARIVSGLLGFSREPDDQLQLIDPRNLVRDVLLLIETQMRNEGIRVEVEVEPETPLILAQPQKLEHVLFNLLSNARHALNARFPLPDKDKQIRILIRRQGNLLQFRVEDAGVGIDAEHLPHLCSPFFTTKPEGEGTGLGLSICWQLVKEHGGQLHFNSAPGHGTRAIVDLPLQPPR
ncbi:hypothetical protein B5V00_04850 [Geothermobacter hydrogeniphilus]|uniref:histidine kinase n=2 Tax=Geothermobacter hydrogeniphilus TaxID=1969733 RepID=A0A1X0YAG8_9BACT|nr:hypothetical protein B5V00_04850 [Geothermobacter hydrogeniphilus]